ncbi:MAG TPA: class I SAM-dependent methyltransferase [Bacteroidia bacterium]|jgi:ubiquinone/menaquinone biosynthesis C-methylase UbiE|nr:class I SAM-dependent methyltransferase [Bacteroidia bacterium]HQF28152.1 class I SAM-dependent methyltransferase [Bacteroidia bacterium]HQK96709.1 class I SAM-dependent methyltransferase [Bacteroidia bacterium]
MATLLPYVSPKTGQTLNNQGDHLISESGEQFPIVKGIPRFVPQDNYASAFGLQWKTYAKTQLDSFSNTRITQDRLERCLNMPIEGLKGKTVLEVGAGAGRFTELLVKGGGMIHSVDLSVAVEVNKENIGNATNYQIAQASVYDMPYPDNSFDYVVCLGVIQHTPDPEKTIKCLFDKVKPGGTLVIDHYIWRIGYYSTLTPLFRAVLKEMKPAKSQKIVNGLVDFFFPIHWALKDKGIINWLVHRVSPLIVYINLFPEQDKKFHYEWSKLDTYDQLTDYYKHLRSPKQIQSTLESLKGKNIWINKGGNGVEARCEK